MLGSAWFLLGPQKMVIFTINQNYQWQLSFSIQRLNYQVWSSHMIFWVCPSVSDLGRADLSTYLWWAEVIAF